MRSKLVIHTVFAWCVGFLPALFLSSAWADAAKAPATAETIPARGSLYRVQHQGNTSWLFGTIHVGKPSFYPLEPRVTQAFEQAGKLVVEVDIRNTADMMAAVGKFGLYADGSTLDKRLSAGALKQLQKTLPKYGMPYEQMAGMKPWMAATVLIALDLERNGLSAGHGTDLFLLGLAGRQTKPVEELETAEYQFSLFDGLPPGQQEQFLRDSLTELASGKATRQMLELMAAWSKADAPAFDRLLREMEKEKTFSAEFMRTVLLEKRNQEMAAKVEKLLRQDKSSSFIAIGLLHLVGEKGLPALLKQRGYQVERVY